MLRQRTATWTPSRSVSRRPQAARRPEEPPDGHLLSSRLRPARQRRQPRGAARLARLAYPYRRRAVFSVVAMIAVTLSSLAVPYLLKVAIDGGIGAKDLAVLTWVIVAFVGVSLVNLGASYLQTYLTSWVGEHIIYDLRRDVFAHLQKLSLDFFSRQKTGWIVSRLTNDIDALDQLVTDGVTTLVTNSLTFIGAIVLLFILD